MAGLEILEQRAGTGEDVTGQQTNATNMDGCGGSKKNCPG